MEKEFSFSIGGIKCHLAKIGAKSTTVTSEVTGESFYITNSALNKVIQGRVCDVVVKEVWLPTKNGGQHMTKWVEVLTWDRF